MKIELTVGVFNGGDLVDTVCYVVPVEPLARIIAQLPEDATISLDLEGIKVLCE